MNIQTFWEDVLAQRADTLACYFHPDATINWHCTNERFTVAEYIRANCEYPGDWAGKIEQVFYIENRIITITRVYPKDHSASFHVTSVLELQEGRITTLDEYWADDGEAPAWRQNMKIGRKISQGSPANLKLTSKFL